MRGLRPGSPGVQLHKSLRAARLCVALLAVGSMQVGRAPRSGVHANCDASARGRGVRVQICADEMVAAWHDTCLIMPRDIERDTQTRRHADMQTDFNTHQAV